MTTIFSKVIAREVPGYIIYEDEYVCAFLDINPIQKGHTLVLPKQEMEDMFNLDEELYDKVMHRVRYVAQILRAKFDCKKICVFVEGFEIPHAHVHLMPCNKSEDFDKKWAHPATKEELEEVQKLLIH